MSRINNILSDRDNRIAVSLILGIFFLKSALAILSEGSFGGADDISHYRIARYAFSFPELFFDQWGKPVFTILASPFAQFGYNGVKIFNVLASSIACWYTYLIARQLKLSFPWFVIILVSFSPIYLVMSYSGMTEIIFSFMIVLSVRLLMADHHKSAIIVLSLLPFARSEGFVIWLPVIVLLIIRRKAQLLPLFLTGFVLFSLIGSLIFKDILWVINQFPYRGGTEIYGHGELLHFVKNIPGTFGLPVAFLATIGTGSLFFRNFYGDRAHSQQVIWYLLLPSIIYFSAHSWVWWRGSGSSAGLIRVMAGIIPIVALISALGIDLLYKLLNRRKGTFSLLLGTLMILTLFTGFRIYENPTHYTDEQKMIREASGWLESSVYRDRKVYYYNPFYFYFRRVDPYDMSESRERVPDLNNPGLELLPGELVMWDSHFSPNEGMLDESQLAGSELFRFVISFGDRSVDSPQPRVALYERLSNNLTPIDPDITIRDAGLISAGSDSLLIPFSSFEGVDPEKLLKFHDRQLYLIENPAEFSPSFHFPLDSLLKRDNISVVVEASILSEYEFGEDEILLVTAIERKGKPYIYLKEDFYEGYNFGSEHNCTIELTIPIGIRSGDIMAVYIWNRMKNQFYISGFRIIIREDQ